MDTSDVVLIVVAIISLIGVIMTSHLSENSKWKKVNEKLENIYSSLNEKISVTNKDIGVNEDRVCLSKQHENMKKSLSMQSSEIKSILKSELSSAKSMLDGLYSKMKADENDTNIKKAVFSASGRSLNEHINEAKCFSELYVEEIKKTSALGAEVERLEEDNSKLNKVNLELKGDIENLKKENLKLVQKLKKLSAEQSQQKIEWEKKIQAQNDCDLNDDAEDEELEP